MDEEFEEKLVETCNTTLAGLLNCSLDLNETDIMASQHRGPEAVVVPLCFALVFVFGLMGNSFLLYYILRKRRVGTPHNCYVVNLAIGDILMITTAMPFVSTIYTTDYWLYGEAICKISEFSQTFCTAITIFTITALSIERYLVISIRDPSNRTHTATIIVFFMWMAAMMLSIPDLVSSYTYVFGIGEFCLSYRFEWGDTYAKTMTMIKFVFLFLLPLLIIGPFYILLAFTLLTSRKSTEVKEDHHTNLAGNLNGKHTSTTRWQVGNQGERRKRIIVVLVFCLVFLFVVCWLPRHIYLMWYYFGISHFNMFWHVFKIVGFCLMFVNSAINPFVFLVFDSGFRGFITNLCKRNNYTPEHFEDSTSTAKQTIVMTDMARDGEQVAV